MVRCLLTGLALAAVVSAQVATFPLQNVRPGMRGIGKTVFAGDRVGEFQFEVLGVLENLGPKQSVVLARLSGGPLDTAGVMQGMSGSPVYLDGKLLGAVAMAFPFAKEPIAGIRPIQEMLGVFEGGPSPGPALQTAGLAHKSLPAAATYQFGESRLVDIATPIAFSGFTRNTLERFSDELRSLGLEPRQGVAGGGKPADKMGDPSLLQPGSMISVQLLSGDMSVGADGTVTAVDGKRIYAFGHRFLSVGSTELPFARAEVLAVLPNLSTSFKISSPRQWMGTITQDRGAGLGGEVGRRAAMIPVSISVARHSAKGLEGAPSTYRIEMVNDRFLAPFLLQMAAYSAIDATERSLGLASFQVRGQIDFQGAVAPVRLNNMYAGDFSVPAQAALSVVAPLSYALQSGFETLRIKNVSIAIDSYPDKKQLQIDQVWAARPTARPGEQVDLTVLLSGPNGVESTHTLSYRVPVGAPVGPLYFTVADGASVNLTEYQQFLASPPKSPAQVVAFLNGLRGNTKAYLRVWRADPSYVIQGEDFPSPPAWLSLILARSQPGASGAALPRSSNIAEMEIPAGEAVVTGSKTVQVEIKE